jgi:putative hydrolase of the HAD superfamily
VTERSGVAEGSDIQCVVFDIDDTLYLERDYVRSGFNHVGDWARLHLGLFDFAPLAWELFERGGRSTIFDDILVDAGIEPTAELIKRMVGVYRAHDPAIELLPDALQCLETLWGRTRLVAVSDGPAESQRAKARALNLDRWMDSMIFTAELGQNLGKPHPRSFELVEERTGCSGSACVYVADNPQKDFLGPAALMWTTVRVRRAFGIHAAIDSGPEVIAEITDLSALFGVLDLTQHGTVAGRTPLGPNT